MIKHLKVYRNRAEGKVDDYNEDMYFPMPISFVSDVLSYALNDGVTELLMQKEDYEVIKKWLAYLGMWDWDRKTFMGMKLIVINQ